MKEKHSYSQRGAVLMLTALLLPLTIAITGVAIDFGNVYLHKSVLQNCADSSALGGVRYTLDKNNNKFVKKDADWEADRLITNNQKYPLASKSYQYLGSKSDPKNTHYYAVILTEKVPMTFLRYFKINDIEITARAARPLKNNGAKDPFSYLFCYRDKLYPVQTVRDNEPYITKNFDGDIVYTNDTIPLDQYDKSVEAHLENGQWTEVTTSNVHHFYRTKGLKDLQHDDDNDITKHYMVENLKLHVDSLDAKIKEQYKLSYNGLPRNISSKDLDNKTLVRCYESSDLTIDREIQGDIDEPVYIYVQESDTFHLYVNENSRRPVIICQIKDTTNPWSRGGKLQVVGKAGKTFRGIFYFPDCTELTINEHEMNFSGSIVAPLINTKLRGSYKYENFISGSGGSSSTSVSSEGYLADNDDVVW